MNTWNVGEYMETYRRHFLYNNHHSIYQTIDSIIRNGALSGKQVFTCIRNPNCKERKISLKK